MPISIIWHFFTLKSSFHLLLHSSILLISPWSSWQTTVFLITLINLAPSANIFWLRHTAYHLHIFGTLWVLGLTPAVLHLLHSSILKFPPWSPFSFLYLSNNPASILIVSLVVHLCALASIIVSHVELYRMLFWYLGRQHLPILSVFNSFNYLCIET